MDRHVSLNTVEMRKFFLFFTVARFFTNRWVFFNSYKSFCGTWDTRHFDTGSSQVGHRQHALGKSMLSSADCFLLLHVLRCGCQEDALCDLSREGFHCVLFSLYSILTHAALPFTISQMLYYIYL